MVSYSRPMGHKSLRTILLHTDPNLRFKIAQRIPKIRLTEKAVPLKIESLTLGDFETVINSQSYNLGIYRHYRTEDIPMGIKYDNKWGGVSCDLDQYGFEIPPSSTPILMGDVSYRRGNEVDQTDTDEFEQTHQFILREYEEAFAKINQLELEGKTVEEFLAGPMNEDVQHFRYILRSSKERIQEIIDGFQSDLLPFHYRRNNLSPPYTCYIQLTMTQGNVRTIQRYVYNHNSIQFNSIYYVSKIRELYG